MAKAPDAFRTISEAAEDVGVPQHVLRFWETKFPFVTPLKRAGGRRFYRPQDLVVLRGLKRLLHEDGMTIRGVQKLHKSRGLKAVAGADMPDFEVEAAATPPAATAPDPSILRVALARVEAARARMDRALSA
ncbi:MAG: MerR family transcriptional regulator [Alphaproteobacteria bacterium]|nr:MerR family transcriptional regulator [Alphaproteobacteria bacterium]MBU1525850.1 MerR family transcriptional regulator [Alphaproteobacteria bacterium]MBU2117443.1 MerR family transcriptional regulator [Alphaproteobacteria bacterium]MBU2350066.1 MerR family transcriptional regulator [Alphaproteobacteria bacterium]MBU2383188.1 MerR family transcriptional regulator [Alphaproteobacteria bacterium]